jgi:spore maturation protein CgeB
VDPETHIPVAPMREFRGELCYLGTYAADRQRALEELFVKPASRLRYSRFVIGGAQYPRSFPWKDNIYFVRHLAPSLHSAFFCSSRATLNITRASMAAYGYCPSGRLFEAAACGAPILSDWWEGLETFFAPEKEILRVNTAEDVMRALAASDADLHAISRAARERTLESHTAAHRIAELEAICESVLANDAGLATAA